MCAVSACGREHCDSLPCVRLVYELLPCFFLETRHKSAVISKKKPSRFIYFTKFIVDIKDNEFNVQERILGANAFLLSVDFSAD